MIPEQRAGQRRGAVSKTDVNSSQFNAMKTPRGSSMVLDKLILKFKWTRLNTAKALLKKNKKEFMMG